MLAKISTKASKDCKHGSFDRLFLAKGFERDLLVKHTLKLDLTFFAGTWEPRSHIYI